MPEKAKPKKRLPHRRRLCDCTRPTEIKGCGKWICRRCYDIEQGTKHKRRPTQDHEGEGRSDHVYRVGGLNPEEF